MKNSISIVTAAFNECPGIISLVNHWLVFGENHPAIEAIEVIVCDDFSAMEQYDMLRQAFENNPQVTILRNEQNEGPGFSFARAIAQASHQWTLITDSDGQFPIENLDVMLPELWSSDASIAFTYRSRKFDNWAIYSIIETMIAQLPKQASNMTRFMKRPTNLFPILFKISRVFCVNKR